MLDISALINIENSYPHEIVSGSYSTDIMIGESR